MTLIYRLNELGCKQFRSLNFKIIYIVLNKRQNSVKEYPGNWIIAFTVIYYTHGPSPQQYNHSNIKMVVHRSWLNDITISSNKTTYSYKYRLGSWHIIINQASCTATHSYSQLLTATHSYAERCRAAQSYAELRRATHRYAQLRTGTQSYAQLRTGTHRYAQLRTATHSCAQLRTATHSYAQLCTAICILRLI